MQRCTKCGKRFDYLELLFSVWNFKGYELIECESCKASYKITTSSKYIIGFLIGGPLVFSRFFFKIPGNSYIYIVYLIVLILISPLILRFREELQNNN